MDAVFRVYDPDLMSKFCLLGGCGAAEDRKVSKWVQTLTTTGVGGVTLNFLPVSNSECNNLAWVGNYVLASIALKLWETIKNTLGAIPLVPGSFVPLSKSRNRSTLPPFACLSKPYKK